MASFLKKKNTAGSGEQKPPLTKSDSGKAIGGDAAVKSPGRFASVKGLGGLMRGKSKGDGGGSPETPVLSKSTESKEGKEEIEIFLESIDLANLIPVFREEQIDMNALKQVSIEDLKELGIPMGPRLKLAKQLDILKNGGQVDDGGNGEDEKVAPPLENPNISHTKTDPKSDTTPHTPTSPSSSMNGGGSGVAPPSPNVQAKKEGDKKEEGAGKKIFGKFKMPGGGKKRDDDGHKSVQLSSPPSAESLGGSGGGGGGSPAPVPRKEGGSVGADLPPAVKLEQVVFDEHWVTIFGFPPTSSSGLNYGPLVLKHFGKVGKITAHCEGLSSAQCNWMHVRYEKLEDAKAALDRNGKLLGSNMMLGVCVPDRKSDSGKPASHTTTTTTTTTTTPSTDNTPPKASGGTSVGGAAAASSPKATTVSSPVASRKSAELKAATITPPETKTPSPSSSMTQLPPPTIGPSTKTIELPDKPGEPIPISAAGVGNLKSRFEEPGGGAITQGRPGSRPSSVYASPSGGRPPSGYGSTTPGGRPLSGGMPAGAVSKQPAETKPATSSPAPERKAEPAAPTQTETTTPTPAATTTPAPAATTPPAPATQTETTTPVPVEEHQPEPLTPKEQPVDPSWDIRIALWDFAGDEAEGQLSFTAGAVVRVVPTDQAPEGWAMGDTGDRQGFFPENYTEQYDPAKHGVF